RSLEIYANAGGVAYAFAGHGWPDAMVAAGGLLAPPLLGALLLAFVHRPKARRVVLVHVLSVTLALDTLTRMVRYAFMDKTSAGQRSDVSAIADNLGGHYVLWGLAITTLALGMLALGLWRAWRRPD